MEQEPLLILVDKFDRPIGKMPKLEVHKRGLLHRAFSIFVFSPDYKELLLQRRSFTKYHSAGLWANTTCSHPRYGEDLTSAAHRRLKEEMGFDTELKHIGWFIYKAHLDNDMIEHELDHLFVGTYQGPVQPNPAEVAEYRWADLRQIDQELCTEPQKYAYWFRVAFPIVIDWLDRQNLLPAGFDLGNR